MRAAAPTLRQGEGIAVRELRLRALADAPDAFSSSFAEETDHPLQRWDELAEQSESGETGVVFLALDQSGAWLGMAGGYLHTDDLSAASLWGLWVDAAARRRGLGRQLVQAVVEWGRGRGVVRLELSVSDHAPGAAELYRALGFAPTGERRTLRSDPSINESLMALSLQGDQSAPEPSQRP